MKPIKTSNKEVFCQYVSPCPHGESSCHVTALLYDVI